MLIVVGLLLLLGWLLVAKRVRIREVHYDPTRWPVEEALKNAPASSAPILILGDASAYSGLRPIFLKGAESFAAESFSIEDVHRVFEKIIASGAKPKCILGALSFGGTMEPHLDSEELKHLGQLLGSARDHGIAFVLVKIPFALSVPAETTVSYWIKYEDLLLASGGPFRLFVPPALPDSHFSSPRILNYEGAKKVASLIQPALENCYSKAWRPPGKTSSAKPSLLLSLK